jgi:endonuclease YncB( thermonuclease family)
MEKRAGLVVLLLMAGCTPAAPQAVAPQPVAPQGVYTSAATSSKSSVPKSIKLGLTLDSPADLKVKLGQKVNRGQVIGDRQSARQPLEQQRQQINLKLAQLTTPSVTVSSSVAAEQARVTQAELKVEQAKRAIAQFKAASPWTDYAWQTLPLAREAGQLSALEAKLKEAQGEKLLAIGKLQDAQSKPEPRAKDTSLQQALLQSQLNEVNSKLTHLGVVRSPYDGTIKSIKWSGQTNQELQVDLTLAVNTVTPQPVAPQGVYTSPKPQVKAQQPKGFAADWQVISVHDGDTIKVRRGQQIERIRFACIDAPELAQPQGIQSRDYLRGLLARAGDRVSLKVVDRDRYGRQVAGVYAGGQFVQAQMVGAGQAWVYERYLAQCPDSGLVVGSQSNAKSQRLGIWANSKSIPPWEWRKLN